MGVFAFDLLSHDGDDLRSLHLADRKLLLDEVISRAGLPCLSFVPHQSDGEALYVLMEELRLEGVVAKRAKCGYRSGRRRDWVKVKTQSWLEANAGRAQPFTRARRTA